MLAMASSCERQRRRGEMSSVRWSGFGQEGKRAEGCREGSGRDLTPLPADRRLAHARRGVGVDMAAGGAAQESERGRERLNGGPGSGLNGFELNSKQCSLFIQTNLSC